MSMAMPKHHPRWVQDQKQVTACPACRQRFSSRDPKIHCRRCGGVFCFDCCNKTHKLNWYGKTKPMRVCNSCDIQLAARQNGLVVPGTTHESPLCAETPPMAQMPRISEDHSKVQAETSRTTAARQSSSQAVQYHGQGNWNAVARGVMVGPYEATKHLGQGSFGVVWQAKNRRTREVVALKDVQKGKLDENSLKEIMREVEIMRGLSHPHLLEMIDVKMFPNNIVFVLEYCQHGDLFKYMKSQLRPLPELRAKVFVKQAARGLRHLQLNGVM